MREKVGKSRNTAFFPRFVAPEGRKVGSIKRRVRSQLARWGMKNCTPLWREARLQVKMYKTPGSRSTFGSWDVEKVHAVVARSTFPSQNAQNTSASDHYWKLRCRKSACRCGAKHISNSKCTKHTTLGPLLEVAMLKKCMPLRSRFPSQNVQNTPRSDHFWKLRWWKSARRCGAKHISKWKCTKHTTFGPLLEVAMSKKCTPLWREAHFEVKMLKTVGVGTTFGGSDVASLHDTTLHYTTLHSTTLHYITLHYTTLHSTTLHYTTLHYTTLQLQLQLHNYTPLQYTRLHSTTLNYTTLHYTTLHYITLHYTTFHDTSLHYTTLHSTTLQLQLQLHNYTPLQYTRLHSTTLNYTTLHYITLHYTTLHYTTLHWMMLHHR